MRERESNQHEHEERAEAEPYLRRLRAGTAYLFRHAHLRASLACSTIMNFAAFVVQALLVLYATRYLQLSAGQIGLALSVGAIGGLAGAAAAGPLARVIGMGRTIALGAVLYCLPFSALAFADPGRAGLVLIAVAEAVSSVGVMLFDINNNAMRTAVTRDDMRSRVAGAYATVNYGTRPLGALAGGLLGDHVGIPATVLVAGLGGILAAVWVITSPVIRVRSIEDL